MSERTAFFGFMRGNGSVGVRNHLLALPSVVCANWVVERIAEQVLEAVAMPHPLGCGQMGADREQTLRVMLGTAAHPNVWSSLVCGLGCEGIQAVDVVAGVSAWGRTSAFLSIQASGGPSETVAQGAAMLERIAAAPAPRRESALVSDLVLGVSDIRDLGAPGRQVVDAFLARGGRVLEATADPLGPDLLAYAAPFPKGATHVTMDSGGGDGETIAGLVAAGAQLVLAAGDGGRVGSHPICPVIRLAPESARTSGPACDGQVTDRTPEGWVNFLLDVANGERTRSEQMGLEVFAIRRLGPTV